MVNLAKILKILYMPSSSLWSCIFPLRFRNTETCDFVLWRCQYITPGVSELHRLAIQYRIILKILLLVYKSLNRTWPSYLAQNLHYCSRARSLRSVTSELSTQTRSFTKTYRDRALAVYAARKWNKIPHEIRKSCTLSSLKRSLKTCLFNEFGNNRLLF